MCFKNPASAAITTSTSRCRPGCSGRFSPPHFAQGSTATAMAGMKTLLPHCSDAPQAILIVPLVGGFLVDLVNALNLTAFISLLPPQ